MADVLVSWVRDLSWDSVRMWSAAVLSLVAIGYTAATYRRNKNEARRDQARFVYVALRLVGRGEAGASGDMTKLNFIDPELDDQDFFDDDPSPSMDEMTIPWPSLLFELRLENRSKELITGIKMSIVTDSDSDPTLLWENPMIDIRLVEPDQQAVRYVLIPDYWALQVFAPAHEAVVKFNDSAGNRWARHGLRPPKRIRRRALVPMPVLIGEAGLSSGPLRLRWRSGWRQRRHPDHRPLSGVLEFTGQQFVGSDIADRWKLLCDEQGLDPTRPPWWLERKLPAPDDRGRQEEREQPGSG